MKWTVSKYYQISQNARTFVEYNKVLLKLPKCCTVEERDLHVALFDVFDALIEVVRDLLPDGDAEVALELGAAPHLGRQHRAQG